MNNLFRFASLGCVVASMALVSCSDNDDAPETPNTPVAPSMGNVFTQGTPMEVDGYKLTVNDKNQVTNLKDEWNDITIEYGTFPRATDFQAKATYKYEGREESEIYLQLNNQGFVTYALQVYADAEEGEDTWKFEYNADGRMTRLQRSEGNDEYTMTYTDGDITKVSHSEDDGDSWVATISYTNDTQKTPIANKGNVMLFDEAFSVDMDEMSILYYAGLLGNGTKNLPMKKVVEWTEGDSSGVSTYTYFWELLKDKDLPTAFWSTRDDSDWKEDEISFTWK